MDQGRGTVHEQLCIVGILAPEIRMHAPHVLYRWGMRTCFQFEQVITQSEPARLAFPLGRVFAISTPLPRILDSDCSIEAHIDITRTGSELQSLVTYIWSDRILEQAVRLAVHLHIISLDLQPCQSYQVSSDYKHPYQTPQARVLQTAKINK